MARDSTTQSSLISPSAAPRAGAGPRRVLHRHVAVVPMHLHRGLIRAGCIAALAAIWVSAVPRASAQQATASDDLADGWPGSVPLSAPPLPAPPAAMPVESPWTTPPGPALDEAGGSSHRYEPTGNGPRVTTGSDPRAAAPDHAMAATANASDVPRPAAAERVAIPDDLSWDEDAGAAETAAAAATLAAAATTTKATTTAAMAGASPATSLEAAAYLSPAAIGPSTDSAHRPPATNAAPLALGPRGPSTRLDPDSRRADGGFRGLTTGVGGSKALVSTAGSLAIVLGLFFVVAWLLRRHAPSGAQLLPSEALEVLGRVPLSNRQQMQLVRLGNKLLLLWVAPTGVETLTEVSDPVEVDALVAVCRTRRGASSAAEFRQLLAQLSHERTPPEFIDSSGPPRGEHQRLVQEVARSRSAAWERTHV